MTSKERHTIAIIDDHPLFRRGVRELLDLSLIHISEPTRP